MNSLLAIFLIIVLGCLLGSVSVKGLSLGTFGILLGSQIMALLW